MAQLTTIDCIHLFSTESEALAWGSAHGLSGFHTHDYQGMTGYMGGSDHNNAVTGSTPVPNTTTTTPNGGTTNTGY